ncbi:MAG: 3-hydroxybutyryl-CoA dehydrogenase, partial [Bacteroidetes bacterium]|nr:3-hydroxybutyryl-CoA dehydrogenase [Bacteroidota bacterium]
MEIKQISVIGSGAMGSGIAQVAAQNDYKVAVYDVNPVALQNAAAKLSDTLEKLQAKGKFSPEKVAQIKQNILWSNKLSEVAKGQLIIEAIVEDL